MTDSVSPFVAAPQHAPRPRPLPLFLDLLRSETAASPERRAKALAGLRRYQEAPRASRTDDTAVVARRGSAVLRDYGGEGSPVVFVPSLINPAVVLDLAEDKSLLRWLVGQGHHVLLVDWGDPLPEARTLDVTGHVEQVLLPMLRTLALPPVLVGYCLGGTMALGAAAALPIAGLALLATPLRFAGFPEATRAEIAALAQAGAAMCEAMGVVPMELLQSGFWQIDPARTIDKFVRLADADAATLAAFVALEDWANDGPPLTLGAGRQLFERFFGADDPGEGRWRVEGHPVDPMALRCPAVDFVSLTDRIVPAASSAGLPDRREVAAGHVGMIVGRGARAQVWTPLADWLSRLPTG